MAAKSKTTPGSSYGARDLAVLEGLEAVRKRPGMYIGSNDGRGLMHCLWEIVDNAVDEAMGGWCTEITVTLHLDGSVDVADNGRGIPVDIEPKTKLTGVEVVMTKLHAGGKFGGSSYAVSGGLHGVGASVVNALSERLDVHVDRGGKTHSMSFRRGLPGQFDGGGPGASFTRASGLTVTGKVAKSKTGTRVRWWADPEVFTKDADYDRTSIRERLIQTSFLVPGLKVILVDLASDTPEEIFCHRGGVPEYVETLAPLDPVTGVIHLTGSGRFSETVPVLDAQGHLTSTDVERELQVDIALQWGTGYDTDLRSFVNVIATPKGGTHLAGFERALVKVVNEAARSTRVLRAAEDPLTKEDALEGLTGVVAVRVPEPQFEGQTKEVLGTPAATRIVSAVVTKELSAWIAQPPRGEKARAKAMVEKIANAMRARVAARTQRDTQRRKTALESSTLPAKLVDCRSGDIERNELFIVEGDSALGTAKLARDSEFQALLPIRGKILNVQKASLADMLKNAECASIIQVVGGGSGRSFDLDAVRYGKIIIMTDADVDGAHIRCLLLTLMHRYLAPLLAAGRVYAAVPPLHRLDVLASGAKPKEVRYTYSDSEMRQLTKDLESKGRHWKDPIQRYKGLGEMDASQLRETTMARGSRSLRRIGVADGAVSAEVFDLLMGSEVAPRRDFIVGSARSLDRSRIDA
ncbi:MAG: type IIA DNA topoisomerase subunit B [Candidatus Nanopelagicales bacterium]|nr:type IIA DNA topoisomerase subunit B [Candidatus Nanopelagicales bacterium]